MPPARILLIDSDPYIAQTVSDLLSRRGHHVEVVGDGELGLSRARALRPELILLDIALPRLDGWDVLRALRADPALVAVPVVLLSSLAGDEDRLRALRLGADDFVAKPFRFEELDLRVQSALRKRHRPPEATRSGEGPRSGSAPSQSTPTPSFGQPAGPPFSGVHGTLDQLGLGSLLAMLEMERKSGILSLSRGRARARLLCRDGQIVRAELLGDDGTSRRGVEAITSMLTWSEGRFDFVPSVVQSADEIGVRTTHLLMEAARRVDEAERPGREVS